MRTTEWNDIAKKEDYLDLRLMTACSGVYRKQSWLLRGVYLITF